MAVAEASLRMVNDSMSLGLIEARALLTPSMPELETGRPSTTIIGSCWALSDEAPRTRIVAALPGWPVPGVTTTPALLPSIRSAGEETRPLLSWSALTVATEPVMSFFLTAP